MKWWQILLDIVAALWIVVCAFFGYMAYALSASWSMSGPVSTLAALVIMSPSLVWFVYSVRKHGAEVKTRLIIVVAILVLIGFLVFHSI